MFFRRVGGVICVFRRENRCDFVMVYVAAMLPFKNMQSIIYLFLINRTEGRIRPTARNTPWNIRFAKRIIFEIRTQ